MPDRNDGARVGETLPETQDALLESTLAPTLERINRATRDDSARPGEGAKFFGVDGKPIALEAADKNSPLISVEITPEGGRVLKVFASPDKVPQEPAARQEFRYVRDGDSIKEEQVVYDARSGNAPVATSEITVNRQTGAMSIKFGSGGDQQTIELNRDTGRPTNFQITGPGKSLVATFDNNGKINEIKINGVAITGENFKQFAKSIEDSLTAVRREHGIRQPDSAAADPKAEMPDRIKTLLDSLQLGMPARPAETGNDTQAKAAVRQLQQLFARRGTPGGGPDESAPAAQPARSVDDLSKAVTDLGSRPPQGGRDAAPVPVAGRDDTGGGVAGRGGERAGRAGVDAEQGGTVEQRQQEYRKLLDFAQRSTRVTRGFDYNEASNMKPEERLAKVAEIMRLPFEQRNHHKVIDLLVAHYDKATTDQERRTALQMLGEQIQSGNLSASEAKMGLSAAYAATRIVDAQLALEKPGISAQERTRAETQRAEALRDLVALATLADPQRAAAAKQLIADLRAGPLKGMAREAMDKAETEVREAARKRDQYIIETTIRAINAPVDRAQASLDALNSAEFQQIMAAGDSRSRDLVALARTAHAIRQTELNAGNPERAAASIKQLVDLEASSPHAKKFLDELRKTDAGKDVIALLKRGDTVGAAGLLANPDLQTVVSRESAKVRAQVQDYGKVQPDRLAEVLSNPRLLEQAKEQAKALDENMRRQAEQKIGEFFHRGRLGDELFKELIDTLPLNKDGSLDGNKLSPAMLSKLQAGFGGFGPDAQPLIAKLIHGARQLTKEDVESLKKAYGETSIPQRDKTLEDLRKLSAERLGRFGGDLEDTVQNLKAINTVQDIHRKLARAMEKLNEPEGSVADRRKALSEVKTAFEQFVKEGANSELARKYMKQFSDADLKRLTQALGGEPRDAMAALTELRTKLPDGHSDLNEFRALRIVRGLNEKSTAEELARASRALESELAAERMAGRPENKFAKEWLKWTEATGAVKELNEALEANDKTKALAAIKSLEGMTPANEHAQMRLFMILQGMTNPGKHQQWVAQAEHALGKPVYSLTDKELSPELRKELAKAAFHGIDDKVDAKKLDTFGAHALSAAYGKLDATEKSAIQRILNVGLYGSKGSEVLTGLFRGIADDGEGTKDLVPIFLKGQRYDSFPARVSDVQQLATTGNPAALRILASLACGCGDKGGQEYSQSASDALKAMLEQPATRKATLAALLEIAEKRTSDSNFRNSHRVLELVGRGASLIPPETTDRESKQLIEKSLKFLQDEYKEGSSDKDSDRYKKAVSGYMSMARHFGKEDIDTVSRDLSPVVIEQLGRFGNQLSAENKQKLVENLAHMAAEGRHFSHGGPIRDTERMAAFEALSHVPDGITAKQLQAVVSGAKGEQQEKYAGLIAVRALAKSTDSEVKALAAKLLTEGLTTWPLDKADRQALIDLYRDGKALQPDVLRRIAKVCREMEIPAPAEIVLTNLGIPMDSQLSAMADRIRKNYKDTPEGGDELVRRAVSNMEAVNALTGRERAQIMGWDKLPAAEKQRLGWFENPPESVLARMGLEKLPAERRQQIEEQVQSALRAGKAWDTNLSSDVKQELLRNGRTSWSETPDQKKEDIRWAEAQKINPMQVIGQMVNGVTGDTANARLLSKDLSMDMMRLHEQRSLAVFAADREVNRLNEQRQQKMAELLKIVEEGPEKSIIGDAYRSQYGALWGGAKALWNGQNVVDGMLEGYSTLSVPAMERLKERLINNGRDMELVRKQVKLLEEIEKLTKDIGEAQVKRAQISTDERRVHLAEGVGRHKLALDSGRVKDADDEAIRLWKAHGPRVMSRPEVWETLNGRPGEVGALARLKRENLSAWDKIPNYETAGTRQSAEQAASEIRGLVGKIDESIKDGKPVELGDQFKARYAEAVANGTAQQFVLEVNRALERLGVKFRVKDDYEGEPLTRPAVVSQRVSSKPDEKKDEKKEEQESRPARPPAPMQRIVFTDTAGKPLGEGKIGVTPPSARSRDQAMDTWQAALGLKPVVVERTGSQKHDGDTRPEPRGLVQISPKDFPNREIRDVLVQHALKSLDSDPVLQKFQQVSAELEGPLSKMSQMFHAGMHGTAYEAYVKEAQKLAGQVQDAMRKVSSQDLKDLRDRVGEMEKALAEMKKQGRGKDAYDSGYFELEKRIDNLKRLHDQLNPGPERLRFEAIKGPDGKIKLDPDTDKPMYKDPYKDMQNVLKAINEGGLKEATFTNWVKENGPLIGATVVAMAATVAACATFGISSPAAVAAWMAVGGLVAREAMREGLYQMNKDGYTGYGTYGDHGADIMHWYRYSDQRTLGSNLYKLGGVAGNYAWEIGKDFVANILTGAVAGKLVGGMSFGEAIASQFKAAPNALHLAFKAERTLLELEGKALAKSYLKEFITHFGEHLVTNAAFAAVHSGVEASLRGSDLHKFFEKGGWVGHEILNWGLSTSLAVGHGYLTAARMKGQEFHYKLKEGMSKTDFMRFMQKEGFIVTESKSHPGTWEAVPVTGGKNAKPIRLVEERDARPEAPQPTRPTTPERPVERPGEKVLKLLEGDNLKAYKEALATPEARRTGEQKALLESMEGARKLHGIDEAQWKKFVEPAIERGARPVEMQEAVQKAIESSERHQKLKIAESIARGEFPPGEYQLKVNGKDVKIYIGMEPGDGKTPAKVTGEKVPTEVVDRILKALENAKVTPDSVVINNKALSGQEGSLSQYGRTFEMTINVAGKQPIEMVFNHETGHLLDFKHFRQGASAELKGQISDAYKKALLKEGGPADVIAKRLGVEPTAEFRARLANELTDPKNADVAPTTAEGKAKYAASQGEVFAEMYKLHQEKQRIKRETGKEPTYEQLLKDHTEKFNPKRAELMKGMAELFKTMESGRAFDAFKVGEGGAATRKGFSIAPDAPALQTVGKLLEGENLKTYKEALETPMERRTEQQKKLLDSIENARKELGIDEANWKKTVEPLLEKNTPASKVREGLERALSDTQKEVLDRHTAGKTADRQKFEASLDAWAKDTGEKGLAKTTERVTKVSEVLQEELRALGVDLDKPLPGDKKGALLEKLKQRLPDCKDELGFLLTIIGAGKGTPSQAVRCFERIQNNLEALKRGTLTPENAGKVLLDMINLEHLEGFARRPDMKDSRSKGILPEALVKDYAPLRPFDAKLEPWKQQIEQFRVSEKPDIPAAPGEWFNAVQDLRQNRRAILESEPNPAKRLALAEKLDALMAEHDRVFSAMRKTPNAEEGTKLFEAKREKIGVDTTTNESFGGASPELINAIKQFRRENRGEVNPRSYHREASRLPNGDVAMRSFDIPHKSGEIKGYFRIVGEDGKLKVPELHVIYDAHGNVKDVKFDILAPKKEQINSTDTARFDEQLKGTGWTREKLMDYLNRQFKKDT